MCVIILLWLLFLIVSWYIGCFAANFFGFHGILWWACSLLFMFIVLGLGGLVINSNIKE